MFYPNCKDEFQEGITYCSYCGIPLISELPKENIVNSKLVSESIDMVEVYSVNYDSSIIPLIESILNSNNIPYIIKEGAHLI